MFIDGLIMRYYVTVSLGEAATQEQAVAAAQGYLQAMVAGGFAQGTFQLFSATGYFNATSNEFVRVGITQANEILLTIYVLNATSAAYVQLAA